MRFTKPSWAGIADGSITVAFRRWQRPTVVVGRPYRTGGGRIEVTDVRLYDIESITEADALAAGHDSLAQMLDFLNAKDRRRHPLYRIQFKVLDDPDPRRVLAATSDLTSDDVAEINARLDRYDRASKSGPWTRPTLELIAANPERRAPDLAEMVGREAQPFKLDVRKLKNLGLTESLGIGYRLSPRGKAFLAAVSGR